MEQPTGQKKRFACEHCNKKFSTKYRQAFHIRNLHSEEPPKGTVCSMCNERFSTRSDMNNHVTTIHMAEKYSCPTCGNNFVLESGHSLSFWPPVLHYVQGPAV